MSLYSVRIVRAGFTRIMDDTEALPSRLRASFRHVEQSIDGFCMRHGLAA